MQDIEAKPKEKRYKGLKAKLIHLDPKVFNMLNMVAKLKNMTLKSYLEELCIKQAVYEVSEVQKAIKRSK